MLATRISHRSHIFSIVVVTSSIYATSLGMSVAAEAEQPATRWWRGNIHTHSLWSDGNDFPEMIADWYRSTATTSSRFPTTTSSAKASAG